jgi:hypothetical protein
MSGFLRIYPDFVQKQRRLRRVMPDDRRSMTVWCAIEELLVTGWSSSLQLCVLRFRSNENGDIGVGILPQR